MRNLISLNNFVSAQGAYYGEYGRCILLFIMFDIMPYLTGTSTPQVDTCTKSNAEHILR